MTPIVSSRSAAPAAMPPLSAIGTPAQREAVKQLAQALQGGDLGQARQAYVGIVKGAPGGATWNPDSAFASLGRALAAGDLPAAKEAAKEALMSLRRVKAPPPLPSPGPALPEEMATRSSANAAAGAAGTSGTLLNVVV